MNLRKAIKELKISSDAQFFVSIYGKGMISEKPVCISDLTSALLKREVLLVQPNHGGQEYGYKLLKFVVK